MKSIKTVSCKHETNTWFPVRKEDELTYVIKKDEEAPLCWNRFYFLFFSYVVTFQYLSKKIVRSMCSYIVQYCTLSLSDLWVARQDNQNKYPMVNTKII